ncbi:MAG: hypothetical protein V4635_02595 [Bacteroidota bacterium]
MVISVYENGKVTTQRNWKNWVLYMLAATEETAIYTTKKINEIDRLFEKTLLLVRKKHPSMKKEIIEKIFEQPYISPRALINKDLKSVNTAKKYLVQLEKLKILAPEKVGKEVIYMNIDLFNLLSEF